MSSSLHSFLQRIGDVTIERVSSQKDKNKPSEDNLVPDPNEIMDEHQTGNEGNSDDYAGDASQGNKRRKFLNKTEEVKIDEGSADDMDLDETIDSHIGVRMGIPGQRDVEQYPSDIEDEEDDEDDDIDSVNILDSLPLEGKFLNIFIIL